MMILLLKLFLTFFKIGMFSFGGGYGILSVMQGEIVTSNQWLSMAEFTDIVAISQMTPGPISINMATYVGYSIMNHARLAYNLIGADASLTDTDDHHQPLPAEI